MSNLILAEFGRNATVKDVEAAYRAIYEQKRQLAILRQRAQEKREQQMAEVDVFLDDLQEITGLPETSPLLAKIAMMCIARRMVRRFSRFNQQDDGDTFPSGW